MHGKRSLEGTFLGGCVFTGRLAAKAIADAAATVNQLRAGPRSMPASPPAGRRLIRASSRRAALLSAIGIASTGPPPAAGWPYSGWQRRLGGGQAGAAHRPSSRCTTTHRDTAADTPRHQARLTPSPGSRGLLLAWDGRAGAAGASGPRASRVAAELLAHRREQLVAVVGLAARAEAARTARVASTGAGTPSSIAASTVQRPSPESETRPLNSVELGRLDAARPRSGRAATRRHAAAPPDLGDLRAGRGRSE